MRPILKIPSQKVFTYASYDVLRHLLIESVGSYCAYCESPITTDFPISTKISVSDVNHLFDVGGNSFMYTVGIKPKRFSRAWVNQQTTCSTCAAAKAGYLGSTEGFAQLYATDQNRFNQLTSGAPLHRVRLTDDEADDLFIAAIQTWVWPDTSSDETGLIVLGGDNTFDLFTYDISSQTQLALATNNQVRLTDDEKQQAWANQAQNGVWVVPNIAYIQNQQNPQVLLRRVTNTILGLNLNYSNPSLLAVPDRRAHNRANTWATINVAINHLNSVVTQIKNANGLLRDDMDEDLEHPQVNMLLWFIRDTLRATGFWSLWARGFLTVINNPQDTLWNAYSSEARQQLIYRLLIQYEIDLRDYQIPNRNPDDPLPKDSEIEEIGIQMVISGTDVNRLSFLQ